MSDPQARLQALSEEFQKLQGGMFSFPMNERHMLMRNPELQSAVESRQKLEGQKQENVGVQQVGHLDISISISL